MNLQKVVVVLLSFPFSNAGVERVFSQLKLIKTDRRSALKHESLLALMQTKHSFTNKGPNQAALLELLKEMLSFHRRTKAKATDADSNELRI